MGWNGIGQDETEINWTVWERAGHDDGRQDGTELDGTVQYRTERNRIGYDGLGHGGNGRYGMGPKRK